MPLDLFVVDHWSGKPIVLNGEHFELKWFAVEEATQLTALAPSDYQPIFRDLP